MQKIHKQQYRFSVVKMSVLNFAGSHIWKVCLYNYPLRLQLQKILKQWDLKITDNM